MSEETPGDEWFPVEGEYEVVPGPEEPTVDSADEDLDDSV